MEGAEPEHAGCHGGEHGGNGDAGEDERGGDNRARPHDGSGGEDREEASQGPRMKTMKTTQMVMLLPFWRRLCRCSRPSAWRWSQRWRRECSR